MREEGKKRGGKVFAINAVIGSLIGMAVCLVLLVVFSLIIAAGKISGDLMMYIAAGVFFVSSFVGGTVAVKKQRGKMLLAGLAEGGILFLITIVVGAFIPGETLIIGSATVPLVISALVGGALAGLLLSKPRKVKI